LPAAGVANNGTLTYTFGARRLRPSTFTVVVRDNGGTDFGGRHFGAAGFTIT
jgi:hypothetical protein